LRGVLVGVIYLLANGVALGLGAAAPIGPVNVEIARRVMRFGRGAGFLVGCGAVTVDVCYAVMASVTMAPVMGWPRVMAGLSVAGALFLAYLGWGCLRSAWGGHGGGEESSSSSSESVGEGLVSVAPEFPGVYSPRAKWGWGHYGSGVVMTALNPMTIAFWFVGVPGAVGRLAAGAGAALPVVCGGVFAGALGWVCGFTWFVGRLRNFGGQRWLRWIDLGGGLMLLAFAVRAIWRLAGSSL
jgi:L-lysine exporter family protein LysE/ArgO